MLRVPLSIFLRAAALSSAVFLRSLRIAICPSFLPYGAGIPTYVLRESRACRLSIQQDLEGDRVASGMFMDLDNRSKHLLRMQDMPPYRSEICLPVFTVRASLACWKLVGNAPRHRSPMTLMYSRSFAITCLSSWSAWHRAFAPSHGRAWPLAQCLAR